MSAGAPAHRCDECAVPGGSSASVVGQHLIYSLVLADDAARWQAHLTDDSFDTIAALLDRGSQIVVTSHERPMREIQAIALLLRSAGMPLQVLVNDGTTRVPTSFAMTGRSPLHLVRARTALRRGDSMLFVLWRAPMRPRGMLPWEAPEATPRPAVGPIVLSRLTDRPISLVRLEVTGSTTARLRLVAAGWEDGGAPAEDEAAQLTRALDPMASRVG